ncbi:MAG: hypothetical protein ACI3W8_02170 [Oscillospiraceae bacterium]
MAALVVIALIAGICWYFSNRSKKERMIKIESLEYTPTVQKAMDFINLCAQLQKHEDRPGQVQCVLRQNIIEMTGLIFDDDLISSINFRRNYFNVDNRAKILERGGSEKQFLSDLQESSLTDIFGAEQAKKYMELCPQETVKGSHVELGFSVPCSGSTDYYLALKSRCARRYRIKESDLFYTVEF